MIAPMFDLLKKTALAGVGATVLTKEAVEKALGELVEKGKISSQEARETAERIAREGKAEFDSAAEKLQHLFNEMAQKAGMGQKARLDALEARVRDLEARLAAQATGSGPVGQPTVVRPGEGV
jgi:polyhydroxyalkanoate synthesis regulator phasin